MLLSLYKISLVSALIYVFLVQLSCFAQEAVPDTTITPGSIREDITTKQQKIEQMGQTPQHKLDSLEHKVDEKIQGNKVVSKADSLDNEVRKDMNQAQYKIDSLNQITDMNQKLQQADQKINDQVGGVKKIQESKGAINNIEQNTGLNVLPDTPGLSDMNVPDTGIPKIPTGDIPQLEVGGIPGTDMRLPDVKIKGLETPGVQGAGLPKDPSKMVNGNTIEKVAEQKITNLPGGSELQQQQQGLESMKELPQLYQKQGERYMDQNHWRKEGQQKALQLLQEINPIESTQKSFDKLKRKYKSVQTDQDVYVKRASLKGDSLKYRITTGFTLQIHQGPPTAFDISPLIGYRWSKRWISGIGVSYRFAFDAENKLNFDQPVYGARVYGECFVLKSFLLHAEGEVLRAYIPSFVQGENKQEWIESILIGGGKQYAITKKLKGNVLYLYTYPYLPYGPYLTKHQIRFGFLFK